MIPFQRPGYNKTGICTQKDGTMKNKTILYLALCLVLLPGIALSRMDSWPLSIDEIIFSQGMVNSFDLASLSGGQAVLAFGDNADRRGKFAVYGGDGVALVGETPFAIGHVDNISVSGLVNGNFLIAYTRDGAGRFVIYSHQGVRVKSEAMFKASGLGMLDTSVLENGNMIAVYRDNRDYCGKYIIFDINGETICDETLFHPGMIGSVSVTPLLNGNAMITYWDGPGDRGAFVICDGTGNRVTGPAAFIPKDIGGPHALTLADGNVMVTYTDRTYPYSGYFIILDPNGSVIRDETGLDLSGSVDRIGSTLVSNHGVLVSFRQARGPDNCGAFIIMDPAGGQVRERTLFYSGVINNRPPVTLSNENVMVPFWEGASPWFGKISHIMDPGRNPWDLDRDGDVDGEDLFLLLQGGGPDPEAIEQFGMVFGE